MSDDTFSYLDKVVADIEKIQSKNGTTVSSPGNAGVAMEPPLKDRIGKNSQNADTQKSLEDVKSGKVIAATDAEVDRIIDRFMEQLTGELFK